jgi:hypothetical protein
MVDTNERTLRCYVYTRISDLPVPVRHSPVPIARTPINLYMRFHYNGIEIEKRESVSFYYLLRFIKHKKVKGGGCSL